MIYLIPFLFLLAISILLDMLINGFSAFETSASSTSDVMKQSID